MSEGTVKSGAKTAAPVEWKVMHDARYLREGGTGMRVDLSTRKEVIEKSGKAKSKQEREAEQKKEVKNAKETSLQQNYTTFLTNHVSRLIELLEDPNITQEETNQFLATKEHQFDRDLLNLLTNVVQHKDGTRKRIIDTSKLIKFLEKPEGLKMVRQLNDQDMAIKQSALAMQMLIKPPGERIMMQNIDTVHLGKDQGKLNEIWNSHIKPFLNVPYGRTGERTDPGSMVAGQPRWKVWYWNIYASSLAAAGGTMVAGPLGGLIGSAAMNSIYLLSRMSRPGVTIEPGQGADALRVLTQNPVEREYARKMYNIHVEDYTILNTPLGGEQVVATSSVDRFHRNHPSNPQKLANELLGQAYTRQLDFELQGVDAKNVDFLPEQHLYDTRYIKNRYGKRVGQPEQIEADYLINTDKLFREQVYTDPMGNRYRGGIRDGAGNYLEMWNPALAGGRGDWQRNPGFNPDVNNWDTIGNLARFRDARIKVMGREMQKFIHEYLGEFTKDSFTTNKSSDVVSMIDGKLTSRNDGGALLQERQKQYEDRINILTIEDDLLTAQKSPLESYREQLDKLGKTRQTAQDEFGHQSVNNLNTLITITKLSTTAVSAGPPPSIMYEKLRIRKEIAEETRKETALIKPKTDPDGSQAREIAERQKSLRQPEIDELDQQITELNTQEIRLKELRDAIKTGEDSLIDSKDIVKVAKKVVEEQSTGYNADHGGIIALNGINGVVLTDAELRSQPVDEILRRLNIADPINWPSEQIGKHEVKMRVLNVAMEVRARTLNAAIGTASVSLGNLLAAGMTENQLRQMKSADVMSFAVAHGVALTAIDAQNVIDESNSHLVVRLQAIEDRKKAIIKEKADQSWRKDRVKNDFDADIKNLTFIKELVGDQSKIFSRILERFNERMTGDPNFANPINPADSNLKPYERSMTFQPAYPPGSARQPIPKGYLEIMDLFWNHKIQANGEAILQQKSKPPYFTPEYVAAALDATLFGGRFAMAHRLDIANVMQAIKTSVAEGRISSFEMIEATSAIINSWASDAAGI